MTQVPHKKLLKLIPFKKRIKPIIQTLTGKTNNRSEFCKRIHHRHSTFWKKSDVDAKRVRNVVMSANDPIEKWKDAVYWQRKLSNKYNSREFAKMHGVRVAELYWRGRDLSTLDFDTLPEHYVIRPTIGHASKLVFVMQGATNLMDKVTYTRESLITILNEALDKNSRLEFLFEEFVRSENGVYKLPDDYKIYMANGEVIFIHLINRLGPHEGFSSFYDENWNKLENLNTLYPSTTYQMPPKCFPEMLNYAKELSKSYELFVRIDFYASDKGATFGEFTPTPVFGKHFTPEAESMFIDYWDRFCQGMI